MATRAPLPKRTAREAAALTAAGVALLAEWPWLYDHWIREAGRVEDGGRPMPLEPVAAAVRAYARSIAGTP